MEQRNVTHCNVICSSYFKAISTKIQNQITLTTTNNALCITTKLREKHIIPSKIHTQSTFIHNLQNKNGSK